MKIVIVEDEPFAQQELLRLMRNTGRDLEVLSLIDSVEESIEWFGRNEHPELVFLDIQLADGLSFDIFKEIELKSAVIFTTAYDEYAINAFKLNSIDYLLKPVKQEELEAALDKYDKMKKDMSLADGGINPEHLQKLIRSMSEVKESKSRFIVRLGEQIKSVNVDEIAYFMAEDNVVFLLTKAGRRYIVDHTLEQIESLIDPGIFFRLNRTYIARIDSIKKVSKYFNSRLLIELDPGSEDQVLVSRNRAKSFLEWFGQ